MNINCYKIIFSKRLGCLVAVGEHTSSAGKAGSGQACRSCEVADGFVGALRLSFASIVFACLALSNSQAQSSSAALSSTALPQGASINAGSANISTQGAKMTIAQVTDKASINWQSFSIGTAATVTIAQPSASSVLLNRVVGNDPSQILGKLSANGQLILLNPNGIVFGKDGSVTASSFTASTFALNDADFMAGFYKYARNGSTAAVVNQGTIETTSGGFVALIGATVTNEGTIRAPQGDVVLAAAESVTLPTDLVKPQAPATPNTVSVRMSKRVRLELDPAAVNTAVNNTESGVIVTEGGQVLLQASALSSAVASVTHAGSIDSSGVQAGAVSLLADKGHIKVSGSITANSSDTATSKGGDITIGRDDVTGALAAITDMTGSKLESQGGFIETSGYDLKVDDIRIKAANWLLDPDNIDITGDASAATAGYSKIKASDITTAINAGTNVTIATTTGSQINQPGYIGGTVTGDGNILVNAAIVKSGSSNASLNLLADNGITVNQRVGKASGDTTSTGTLNVTMTSGGVASVTGTSLGLVLNNVIDANGGTVNLTGTTSNATQNGVTFGTSSGLKAATYTVTGTNTSAAGGSAGSAQATGVLFRGTTDLISNTGASTITGDTRNTNGYGVMFYPGTSTLDAGTSSLTIGTASTSVMGMRSGWGGSSTINTKGNVTLGSKNNSKSDFMIQGVINAQSGSLTLLGKSGDTNGLSLWDGGGQVPKVLATNGASITMNGESSKAGAFGVILAVANQAVISSDTGAIDITGSSSGSTGIYTQNNTSISSSNGGNITLTGNATGAGGGVGLNLTNGSVTTTGQVQMNGTAITNIGVINNAAVTGGSVSITGTASGNAGGISNSGTVTATAGNVNITGSSGGTTSGGGVYSSAAITSNTGDVNITGTALMGGGVTVQGTVTAQNHVTINGTSSDAASTAQGVVIQNAVKANTGDITVTGNTNSNVQRAVAITANGAVNGSLQTLAAGHNININADTLYVNALSSVDTGATGTVTIKTTSGNRIELGSADTVNSTASSRILGLDQSELDRITASQLNIGATNGGNVKVATGVTTATSSGNLALRSGGNIAIDAALTVGSITPAKTLTLQGAGASSSVTQTAAIKAAGLELLGTTASYTLNNSGNDIKKLAANTQTISLTNNQAFAIDSVNTVGLTTSGNTSLSSTASVTQTQRIAASGLDLLGAAGSYTLTHTANSVSTLAANTGTFNFVNASALVIGTVSGTDGITASGNVSVKTLSGDLTLNKNISTTGTVSLEATGAIARTAGTLSAGTLNLKAGNGIGASGAHIQTNVDYLSLDAGGDIFITEANNVSVSAQTTANNGSIDLVTTNGTLSVSNVNGIRGITSHGTGNIDLTGNTNTGSGIYLGNDVTATNGDINLTGTTASTINYDAGIKSNSSAIISAKNITMVASATGTSGSVLGYYGAGATFNASQQLNLTGTTASAGNGFYSFTGSFTAGTGLSLNGTSATGQAVRLDNRVTLTNGNAGGISITGTATTTTNDAIGLRGMTITNNGGDLQLTALSGGITTNSGDLLWGNGVLTNTILNANTAGAVRITAGNGSNTSTAAINGSVLNITQSSNAGVTIISSGTGNVTSPKITNNGTGSVVIAAGSAIAAGTGTGGQVLSFAGNNITQNSTGTTYIYSGQASDTGVLSNINSAYNTLYYEGTSHAVNTGFNKAYDGTPANDLTAPAGGSVTTDVQVFFRSNTKPNFALALNDLNKHYGDVDPTAFVATGGVTTLTNAYAGIGGSNNFFVATADVIANLTGTRAAGENVGTYAYTLDGSSMNTTLATQPNLNIAKRDITATSITAASKQYDGGTTATINGGVFSNLANAETLSFSGSGVFVDPNAGNGKVVNVADITSLGKVNGTGLWSNYNLTSTGPISGTGNITQAPLTLTVNNSSVFVTQLASNAPDHGFSYSGFLNGDTAAVFNSMPTRSYTGAASYPVAGTYNGTLNTSAVPTSTNYLVTVVPGNLTVTPADKLLITIGSQSAAYGSQTAANAGSAAAGTVTAQYCFDQTNCNGANLVNLSVTRLGTFEWKASDITGSYVVFDTSVIGAQASSSGNLKVGNYTYDATQINPLSLPNGNFNGRAVNAGVLTITPLAVNLASVAVSKPYDGTTALPASIQPTTTLTASNALAGDTVDVSFVAGAYTSSAASTSASFNLTGVQLSGADASNYSLANYVNSTYSSTGSITGGNNAGGNNTGSNSIGPKAIIVVPPNPIIPNDTQSNEGAAAGSASQSNPYIVLPKANKASDRCSPNSLEDCLCETQESPAIEGLAICYQPNKTASTPSTESKPPKQRKT